MDTKTNSTSNFIKHEATITYDKNDDSKVTIAKSNDIGSAARIILESFEKDLQKIKK